MTFLCHFMTSRDAHLLDELMLETTNQLKRPSFLGDKGLDCLYFYTVMVINDQFRKQQQTIIWFEDLNPIKLQFDSISLPLSYTFGCTDSG